MMLESAVESHLRRRIKAMGGESYKLVPAHAGLPDRMVLMPGGRIYLVELKADSGALRPVQVIWHERARELGTEVVVLKGRIQVDEWLRHLRDA
jgi:hypothetical protein